MSTQSLHRQLARRARPAVRVARPDLRRWRSETMRVAELAIIAMLAFLVMLGAFSPSESQVVWIAIAGLVVLYCIHPWALWRRGSGIEPSPEGRRAGGRRG